MPARDFLLSNVSVWVRYQTLTVNEAPQVLMINDHNVHFQHLNAHFVLT